jgi:pimeloyl-ACP methyl ester carboxylesterase
MDIPDIRYAKTVDGIHIAYEVVGEGPVDLVYVPGWNTWVKLAWENPLDARFLESLASFSRLILLDRRGFGLSDSLSHDTTHSLEDQMYDISSVLDAVGSDEAVAFGEFEGGPLCTLFAATHPSRTRVRTKCSFPRQSRT